MLYSSRTGNTELMVKEMLQQLKVYPYQVVTKKFDSDSIDVKELLRYDAIFIGVYTWAAGDLPLAVEDFYDDLYNIDLNGKVCGVFGSADTSYEDLYGLAVDLMFDELKGSGATMIQDKIIADLEPTSAELKRCRTMVDTAIKMIEK